MSLRARFWIFAVVFLTLLVSQFVLVWLQKKFADDIIEIEETNFVVNLVAEEFRITSRDLTQYARAFCATGNQDFYKKYQHILNWRSGKTPRPAYLDRRIAHLVNEPTISQTELLQRLGLSVEEDEYFEKALERSDDLALLELQAMQSRKIGNFVDGPLTPFESESLDDFIIRALYGSFYQENLDKIAVYIGNFFDRHDETAKNAIFFAKQRFSAVVTVTFLVQLGTILALGLGIVHLFKYYQFDANERVQLMLDATPLCCNLWDENFNNIECNLEAVRLFELPDKKTYLSRFFELSPEFQPCGKRSAELAAEYIKQALETGFTRFEWMHQKLSGEPVPSEITLVRVERKDSFIVAGYTRDLREHKAMLAEMQKVEDELRVARDAAQASAQSKSEFLANMSHEIRTPMNAILGMNYLCLQTDLTEKQQDYLLKSQSATVNLLGIINDILDFSKMEAGKISIEETNFQLSVVLDEIVDVIEIKANENRLSLETHIEDSVHDFLIGDPLRLRQVLLNLLSNAVKFTEKGTVQLFVKVADEKTPDEFAAIAFTVKDNGIGMTAEQLESVFDSFSQADRSTTRKYGGTGLGLPISKNLVELMGGKIEVASKHGEGTSFSFVIRFRKSRVNKEQKKQIVERLDKMTGLRGIKVLLAEDNKINQIVAFEILKQFGANVSIANDGIEAVELAKKSDFDVILMDIQMPNMDGLDAARAIRDLGKKVPILAMTAHAMSGDKEISLAAGMNGHITKPIDPKQLYEILLKVHLAATP